MNTTSRRRLAVSAAVGAVALVAGVLILRTVASDDEPASKLLSESTAASSILTVEDLGAEYSAGDDEATSYARQAPGCLEAVRPLVGGAPVRVVKTFHGPATEPMSVVSSQVSSYPSAGGAKAALASFRERTDGCSQVRRKKGEDGFELTVSTRRVTAPSSDEQVALRAVGSMVSANDQGFPFGMWISVVRVGNNLAIVRLFEVPEAGSGGSEAASAAKIDELTLAASKRLVSAS